MNRIGIFKKLQIYIDNCIKENNFELAHEGYIDKDFFLPDRELYNNVQQVPFIIQQVKKEIEEFVDVVLAHGISNNVLEIGLGRFGSTHILWREIFKNVVTLECNNFRIKDFSKNVDYKSTLICCDSNNPNITKILPHKSYDLLFIDGAHDYESIKKDYLNFAPMVIKNGIIAFHDILNDTYDVKFFINDLEAGLINGVKTKIHRIEHSKQVGIGYYINDSPISNR